MTIYGCTGRIFDYVKIPQAEAKGLQKKLEPVEPSGFSALLKQSNEAKKASALECISNKIKFGKRLTRDEMDFLKVHNPDLYARAVKIEQEREEHRRVLRSCKTKEEARNAHIAKAFQPYMDVEVKLALFDEFTEFVKSGEFGELLDERELDEENEENVKNEEKIENEDQNEQKIRKKKAIRNYEMQKREIKNAYIYLPDLPTSGSTETVSTAATPPAQ
ncbi:MAG: hypothetical protein LBC64_04370 [Fibromonadaceae bacterium]|jgi:hypothetical protein|nr:hypothetical protein [Fibromonadaceae bacterium]